MSPIVLVTDVVSYLFKGDTRAQRFLPRLTDRQWHISFMTEAELEQWVLLANWSETRIHWLRLFLDRFIIVPSSRDLVLQWAEVMVTARRNGRRIETADAWVAATALLYGAPLLTNNKADYAGIAGLQFDGE